MTLVDKEVLSARKLVYSICLVQLFALGIIGHCLSHLSTLEEPRTFDFRVFWWGYIEYPVRHMYDLSSFEYVYRLQTPWLCYLLKILGVTRSIIRALAFTHTFNDSERKAKAQPLDRLSTTDPSAQIDLAEHPHGGALDAPAFESVKWLGIPIPFSTLR